MSGMLPQLDPRIKDQAALEDGSTSYIRPVRPRRSPRRRPRLDDPVLRRTGRHGSLRGRRGGTHALEQTLGMPTFAASFPNLRPHAPRMRRSFPGPSAPEVQGHRTPGRDGLGRLAPTGASDPDADLGVLLRDIHPGTPGVNDFHHHHFPSARTSVRASRGGQGETRSLTHGLYGTNPRFPWKPSATMLTFRLTGTTESTGSTTTNPTSLDREEHLRQQSATRRIFAHHGAPRRRRRAADLRKRGDRRGQEASRNVR
jgi:hypothetical protein